MELLVFTSEHGFKPLDLIVQIVGLLLDFLLLSQSILYLRVHIDVLLFDFFDLISHQLDLLLIFNGQGLGLHLLNLDSGLDLLNLIEKVLFFLCLELAFAFLLGDGFFEVLHLQRILHKGVTHDEFTLTNATHSALSDRGGRWRGSS